MSSAPGESDGATPRPYRIRAAVPDDAAELARVAAVTFPLACPPDATAASVRAFIDLNLSEDRFTEYLSDADHELLIAEDSAGVAGYAMVVHGEPTDPDVLAAVQSRPTAELSKLYVMPDRHGNGLARTLLEAAIQLGADRGARSVWLGVNQFNERANRFYEKNGMRQVGTKRFQVGDRLESDFVRVRELNPDAAGADSGPA